ncbi:MAG: hypothetical protein K2L80_10205 [Muribaculaceae bacterium]|nr:hypothetical protein [Muribaculaceae bacterium]MDE6332953.1 hypothetical protein [Muribaculaceae bacterium]
MKRARNNSQKVLANAGDNRSEVRNNALETIHNIIENEHVAKEFFFVDMFPKMTALADSYNRAFGLDLYPEDVARATYLSCWENDWAKLRAFKGESSPYAWVARIASQATYRFLVEEKYIDGVDNTKTNDYRLTVRSIEDVRLRQAIVDMVFIPDQHKALELFYVTKYEEDALVKAFGETERARNILKTAEKTLIEQLLNTENPYAEMALSTKKAINPEVRFQPWHDRIDEGDVSENHQTLRDLLANLYKNEDWDANAIRFINSVLAELDWTEIQKEVWRERFFHETPSKELAIRFQVRNTWIDNTYSRLNKQFRIAVKTWWKKFNR